MSELEKKDVVEEFIERMKANAKPIYQFIREGKSDEDVVQLHLILANYANTEHTLNILKKQYLELKQKLEEHIKTCPLVPELTALGLKERAIILVEHSMKLDEWYHKLKELLKEVKKP